MKDKIPETVNTDQVALFSDSMRPKLDVISATFALDKNRHFVKDIEEGTLTSQQIAPWHVSR